MPHPPGPPLYVPRSLDRLARAVVDGRANGRALVLTGAPGCGKSALLRELARQVGEEGTGRLVLVTGRALQGRSLCAAFAEEAGLPAEAGASATRLCEALVRAPGSPSLVLDGLDEASDPAELVRELDLLLGVEAPVRLLVSMRRELWLKLTPPGAASPFRDERALVQVRDEAGLPSFHAPLRELSERTERAEAYRRFLEQGSPAPRWEQLPTSIRALLGEPAKLCAFHAWARARPEEGPARWIAATIDEALDAPVPEGTAPEDLRLVRRRLRELRDRSAGGLPDGRQLQSFLREHDALPPAEPSRRTLAEALRALVREHARTGLGAALEALVELPAGGLAAELLELALVSPLPPGEDAFLVPRLQTAAQASATAPMALLHAAAEAEPWLVALGRAKEALALAELRLREALRAGVAEEIDAARSVGRLRMLLEGWSSARAPLERSVTLARSAAAGGERAARLELARSLHELAWCALSTEDSAEIEACFEESAEVLSGAGDDELELGRGAALEQLLRLRDGHADEAAIAAIARELVAVRRSSLARRPDVPERLNDLRVALGMADRDPDPLGSSAPEWEANRREQEALAEQLRSTPSAQPSRWPADLGAIRAPYVVRLPVGRAREATVARLREEVAAEPARVDLELALLDTIRGDGPASLAESIERLRLLHQREPARVDVLERLVQALTLRRRVTWKGDRAAAARDQRELVELLACGTEREARRPEFEALWAMLLDGSERATDPALLHEVAVHLRAALAAAPDHLPARVRLLATMYALFCDDEKPRREAALDEAVRLVEGLPHTAKLLTGHASSYYERVELLVRRAIAGAFVPQAVRLGAHLLDRLERTPDELQPAERAEHRLRLLELAVRREARFGDAASVRSALARMLWELRRQARASGPEALAKRTLRTLRASEAVSAFEHGTLSMPILRRLRACFRAGAERGLPEHARAETILLLRLARLSIVRGEFTEADGYLRARLELDPRTLLAGESAQERLATALVDRGLLRQAQGRLPEARRELEEAHRLRRGVDGEAPGELIDRAETALLLAGLALRQGDTRRAAGWFRRAHEAFGPIAPSEAPEAHESRLEMLEYVRRNAMRRARLPCVEALTVALAAVASDGWDAGPPAAVLAEARRFAVESL